MFPTVTSRKQGPPPGLSVIRKVLLLKALAEDRSLPAVVSREQRVVIKRLGSGANYPGFLPR